MGFKLGGDARKNLKGPGYHLDKDEQGNVKLLDDAQGVPTGTFHNPKTGQEFHGLPTDPWSMEKWIRVRRFRRGPAPAALRKKWTQMLAKRAKIGVKDTPAAHDLPVLPAVAQVKELETKVEALTAQVEALLKLAAANVSGGSSVVE